MQKKYKWKAAKIGIEEMEWDEGETGGRKMKGTETRMEIKEEEETI